MQAYTAQWQRHCPDITPPQYAVLLTLRERPSITQTHLGTLTGIDLATLTPLVRALEDRRLLTRRTDDTNRRRKILELTDEGAEVVDRVRTSVAAIDKTMLAGLSADHRHQLVTALADLAELSEPSPGGSRVH